MKIVLAIGCVIAYSISWIVGVNESPISPARVVATRRVKLRVVNPLHLWEGTRKNFSDVKL